MVQVYCPRSNQSFLSSITFTYASRSKFENISDVIIVTEDNREFRAHKCILSARLEYFRSMFSMGWIESGQKVTQVKLPITGPLCQVLLEHLYTDLEAIPNRYIHFLPPRFYVK